MCLLWFHEALSLCLCSLLCRHYPVCICMYFYFIGPETGLRTCFASEVHLRVQIVWVWRRGIHQSKVLVVIEAGLFKNVGPAYGATLWWCAFDAKLQRRGTLWNLLQTVRQLNSKTQLNWRWMCLKSFKEGESRRTVEGSVLHLYTQHIYIYTYIYIYTHKCNIFDIQYIQDIHAHMHMYNHNKHPTHGS